jgi:hypothetical protein
MTGLAAGGIPILEKIDGESKAVNYIGIRGSSGKGSKEES